MIDLLAGALTGGGISHPDVTGSGNNMLSIYIDPNHVVGSAEFEHWAADLAVWVRSSAPLSPQDGAHVLAPGDREAALTLQRQHDGLPIDEETRNQLVQVADRFGVPFPRPLIRAES